MAKKKKLILKPSPIFTMTTDDNTNKIIGHHDNRHGDHSIYNHQPSELKKRMMYDFDNLDHDTSKMRYKYA